MKKILSQDEKFQRMLEAPLPGLIGKLAVPTIISMLITSFYNMADTFFVGKIGTSATAAVGVVFHLCPSYRPSASFSDTAPEIPYPESSVQRNMTQQNSLHLPDFSQRFSAVCSSQSLVFYF